MVEYYREGSLVNPDESVGPTTQEEIIASTPIAVDNANIFPSSFVADRSDVSLAFSKGARLLKGSAETTFKGFTGELLRQAGLEEQGLEWLSNAYQSGLLMGMDVNEIDEQLKGPKTLNEIDDWKGAVSWGVNAVAEQVPNLMTTFAPAVVGAVLKRPVTGTVGTLATIDFLNTAEVYTDLLLETTQSRPAVAASTGVFMSLADAIIPLRVLGKTGLGGGFASHFGKKIKDPNSNYATMIANVAATGAGEGFTEYLQTMMEGMALNYVKENDKLFEFTKAQQEEQLEAGARGALIGTLLGIPIAYSGRSAKKAAKKFSDNVLDDLVKKNVSLNQQDQEQTPSVQAETSSVAGENFILHGGVTVQSATAQQIARRKNEQIFQEPFRAQFSVDNAGNQILTPNSEYELFKRTGQISDDRIIDVAFLFQQLEKGRKVDVTPEEVEVFKAYSPDIRRVIQSLFQGDDLRSIKKRNDSRLKGQRIESIYNNDVNKDIQREFESTIGELEKAINVRSDRRELKRKESLTGREAPPLGPPDRASVLSQRYFENLANQKEQEERDRSRVTDPDTVEATAVPPRQPDRAVGIPFVPDTPQDEAIALGFDKFGSVTVVKKDGTPVVGSKGTVQKNTTYENAEFVIKKASPEGILETTLETTTTKRGSSWVVIDKGTGKIVDSAPPGNKGQTEEQLKEGLSNVDRLLFEKGEISQGVKEDSSDIKSKVLTQELSQKGVIPINEGDIVRRYNKKQKRFVDDIEFEVLKVDRAKQGNKEGIRYKLKPVGGKTLEGRAEITAFQTPDQALTLSVVRPFAEIQESIRGEVVPTEEQFLKDETTSEADKQEVATKGGLTQAQQLRLGVQKPERKPIKRLGATKPSIIKFDPSTGDRPSPETHRVRLTPQAAKKHGLDPSFNYDWEPFSFPQWGDQSDDFIKVAGQLVRHQDRRVRKSVKGKPNITEILTSGISSVRKKPSGIKVKEKNFVKIDPSMLPENVPDKKTIERAFIDQKTGLFIVHRKKETEESPAYDSIDVEVYLTYNTKKEYQSKIEALRDFYSEYERIETPAELTKAEEFKDDLVERRPDEVSPIKTVPALRRKSIRREVIREPRYVEGGNKTTRINVSSVIKEMETPGSVVTVKVKPAVISKINREREENDLPKIDSESFLNVVEYPLRKGMVTVSSEGIERQIKIESIVDAKVTKFTPDREGALNYHEITLDRSPERQEAMLISAFKVSNAEATSSPSGSFKFENSYDKFREELFSDTAHRYGIFGTGKEGVRKRREETFRENKGQNVIVHLYGGVQITGVVDSATNGTLRLSNPQPVGKESRLLKSTSSMLIDLLNIESFQLKRKPGFVPESTVIKERTPETLFRYFPVNEGVATQEPPVVSESPDIVNVFKNEKSEMYRVLINDRVQEDALTLDKTIDYLNKLDTDTQGNIDVLQLPNEIVLFSDIKAGEVTGKQTSGFKYNFEARRGRADSETTGRRLDKRVKYIDTDKAGDQAVVDKTKNDIDNASAKEAKNILDTLEQQKEDAFQLINSQRNSAGQLLANNSTKTYEEFKDTPFINMPTGQKFRDKNGGMWKVLETVGRHNTSVQFMGGPTPDIEFQVTWEGRKSKGKLEPNYVVTVRGSSTPSSMEIKTDNGRFANYSIVRPVPADGKGSIKYNTGLTPKEFQRILGPKIGNLNVNRLINKGLIKVVQNQKDVDNAPIDLAVKSITRNGELIFITNNIKAEEVLPVFVHEVGVHIGLKEIYGSDFANLIAEVKARKNNDEWSSSFKNAETVADQFSFVDDISKENFIAEEALAYYVESNNNFKDSFWQNFLDLISRWVARTKMWFNGKLSNQELVAFARGAVAGMSERNFENAINVIDEVYYSTNEQSFNKVGETFEQLGEKFDGAVRAEYVSKTKTLWNRTKKFFDPFAMLPFARDFRKLRALLQGKLGEIEQFGDAVAEKFDNLNAVENQELFDYFTNQNASEETISRADLRDVSVALKKKIIEIADEGVLRGIYPEASQEQMQELKGAYLPRVFLYHILKDQGARGAGQRKTSPKQYTKLRMEDMESDLREILSEIKDVRYLLYRAVTIPQQDIAIIDFLEQISVQQAFVETPEAKSIKEKIDSLMIERQKEGATQEDRDRLLKEIEDLRKEQKTLGKEGKRFVAGNIPWVMPNQWVTVKIQTKDGVKNIKTTLASVNRQIKDWNNYKDNAVGLKESVIEQINERIIVLEKARKEFLDSVRVDSNIDPNLERNQEKIEEQISAYYDDNYDISLFKKMPNDPDRYGSMANLYVRKEVYDDILGNSDMVTGEQNLFQRMLLPYGKHAQLVSIFKTMKVPLNPPTVVRNFVANLIMMQLFGGVAFRRQPVLLMETLREMRGQEKGTLLTHSKTGKKFTAYELAMEQGIGATTLTNAELRKLEKVFSFMEKDGVWGVVTKGQKLWGEIAGFGTNLYQGIETFGKVAVISDLLQNQRSELEKILKESNSETLTIEDIAVQEANRVLFDYSEVHPNVRGLRSSFLGAPFITYQVKVLPQLVKILADKSKWHRFLPYVMMVGGMQALFGSIPFIDDDWDKMEELLPEWTKDNTMVFLPWKDSNDNWQAADLSYFFPWSWYINTGSNLLQGEVAKAAVEGGVIGPGFQLMTTFLTGKDPWSGYQIVNENDALSDRMFDYMSYANSTILPPFLTRNGIVSVSSALEAAVRLDPTELEGKLPDLLIGRTNRYGQPKRSAMGVLGSAFGLTTYSIPDNAISIQKNRFNSEIRSLKSEITSTKKNKKLSPSEKKRKVNSIKEKIDKVREDKKEFSNKTSGIERTL